MESPAKSKTINKFLGKEYEVKSSMGHLIDLPKSKMGIDIENDFQPQYVVIKGRQKILTELKKSAKNKKEIYLACDPDREGEAICWHLSNQLNKGQEKIRRVMFHEITPQAIQEAFKHPTKINMNKVGAQQARRVLDRLVGYSISPILWQKVGRGLSAGRVQSVALRLIVDQERRIKAFVPQEYWSIEAELQKTKGNLSPFAATLEKVGTQKAELKNKDQAQSLSAQIKKESFIVREVRELKKKRNPGAPFTTSKLQQEAFNRLRFPAAKTMRIAQQLYEGIELGDGETVGLITYMRTDSVQVSQSAMGEVREFISKKFGSSHLPPKPNFFKARKRAQEAHEAIRPTSVLRIPAGIQRYLTDDQFKLYQLIWQKFVASQMKSAIISQESVLIEAGKFLFRASGSRVEFDGFLAAYGGDPDAGSKPLPPLSEKEILRLITLKEEQHFTKPPARFTDASLVKALEEKGIGRPSTYAPIIQTIVTRDYVRREGGSLVPTDLGMLVTDLLLKHFAKIMDVKFTAAMEDELDQVEEGKVEWIQTVREFYGSFAKKVEMAKEKMTNVKKEVLTTDESCSQCGRPMVIKWGRRGKFLSCSAFPDCREARSISTGISCPSCKDGKLVARRARTGRGRTFYGCTRYPQCTYIAQRLPSAGTEAGNAVAEKNSETDEMSELLE